MNGLVVSPVEQVLERALAASALRHKVIANNIANVNTPGFKKSRVRFEDELQQALDGSRIPLAATDPRHLPGRHAASIPTPQTVPVTGTTMRRDGNNVDIDQEMALMAENNIYYSALAQQMANYFSGIKTAINGGGR